MSYSRSKQLTFKKALYVFTLSLLFISAVYSCAKEQGRDEGYAQATADIYSALKEQASEGTDFFIKDMPSIKFMPRKDGAIKYAVAGAESFNRSQF